MKVGYPEYGISIESGSGRDTTGDTVRCELPGSGSVTILNDLSCQPALSSLSATLGIKSSGKPDFTVIKLAGPSAAAGVFTKNRCPSITVTRNRAVLSSGTAQLIAVNSGNANVFTPTGEDDVNETATLLSAEFGVAADQMVICSTGVIGVPLPMERFRTGIPGLAAQLKPQNLDAAAEAILTTDLGPKVASLTHRGVRICGIAKGAGMIEPNLATMLVYLFTDANLDAETLRSALHRAADDSFNCMSVDTDTSTSDSVVLASTGEAARDAISPDDFTALLRAVCIKLSRDIVSQGEGVTKIIEAEVRSDASERHSRRLAKQIINSPLFKCAVHGSDPNWGRVVMAIGKGESDEDSALVDPASLEIVLQGMPVFQRGSAIPIDKNQLRERMLSSRVVHVAVTLGAGRHLGRAWGCDLSKEYVSINADYTT